jgi:transposase
MLVAQEAAARLEKLKRTEAREVLLHNQRMAIEMDQHKERKARESELHQYQLQILKMDAELAELRVKRLQQEIDAATKVFLPQRN